MNHKWAKQNPKRPHNVDKTTPKRLKCTRWSLTGVYFASLFRFVCLLLRDRIYAVVYGRVRSVVCPNRSCTAVCRPVLDEGMRSKARKKGRKRLKIISGVLRAQYFLQDCWKIKAGVWVKDISKNEKKMNLELAIPQHFFLEFVKKYPTPWRKQLPFQSQYATAGTSFMGWNNYTRHKNQNGIILQPRMRHFFFLKNTQR